MPPHAFDWIVPGQLGACANPALGEAILTELRAGRISLLVNLHERPDSPELLAQVPAQGLPPAHARFPGTTQEQQTPEAFPREMLQTVVRESARLGEAFSYARTIVEHDPEGMGAADYRAVAEELLERWKLPMSAAASAMGGRYGKSEG